MALLSVLVAVTLVSSLSQTCAITSCPRVVKVEIGTNYNITCTADTNMNDFYWYKGPASDHDLVGKLENGLKSVSVRYKDEYDVSLSGALVILNAGITHESRYDLVTFDANGKPEGESVNVNITISPDLPCPLINDCTSCEQCKLPHPKKAGTLTCQVKGSRPHVPLKWKTVSQNGISVLAYRPHIQQSDASTGAWDSSVSLEYKITAPCEARIVLQCVAEDTQHILNSTVSTIEISTDQCNATPTYGTLPPVIPPTPPPVISPTSSSSLPAVVTIPVALFTVLLTGVIAFIVIYKCRRNRNAGYDRTPLSESISRNKPVQQLVWSLKDRYQKFCHLKPLQWVEDINIADLYVESQCTVKDKNMSTLDLKKTADIFTKRWVYFIADLGYGRTTFLKKVVQEWIKDDKNMLLIVYISLKEVRKSDTLSQIIVGDKPKASRFQTDDIEAILKTEECLVILDGFEDLRDDREDEERDIDHPVTIGQLLLGRSSSCYTRLRVWVSLREADCKNLPSPQDKMEVRLTGFSDEQFLRYMLSCCHYYFSLKTNKKSAGQSGSTNGCNNSCNVVENFLQENEIRTKFKETPLLTNLMLHILAAKLNSTITLSEDKTITDMYNLMRVVIDSMEARYNYKKSVEVRSIYKKSVFETPDFTGLETKLGEFALQHKKQLTKIRRSTWEQEIGKDNLDTALEIGLLKQSKHTESDKGDPVIKFYHQQIGDYLAKQVSCGT